MEEKQIHRCECDQDSRGNMNPGTMYGPEERKAMRHAPGECPGDYGVKLYQRGDRQLWLCSCCNLGRDIEIV